MNKLLSPSPLWQTTGLTLIRLVTASFMTYHGWEVFSPEAMNSYLQWDLFKGSSGKIMVYAGKTAELTGGIFLFIGLFTRIAAIILIGTMVYISFFVGHGKIWYEDQYPFLFVLLGLVFFFTGGGKWSVDHFIFKKNQYAR
ncbi:MAG: DoxX family protein [Bacteroidota bacterium]